LKPYKDGKWKLGNPDKNENLRARYREVLAGFESFSYDDLTLRGTMEFELALADIYACRDCKSVQTQVVRHGEGDEHPVTVRDDCRGATGHGLYTGLHHGDCARYKKPMFRAFPCGGPLARLEKIRDAMRRDA
jgi:hypothetical protein